MKAQAARVTDVLVVGAGMAAHRFCGTLGRLAPERFRVTLIGEESTAPYNRIGLSSVLAGEARDTDLLLEPNAAGISFLSGRRVLSIDRDARAVTCSDGSVHAWDTLVLACGSRPIVPAIPGAGSPGVRCFRTLEDVHGMLAEVREDTPVVVIGGGLLGIEAAHGLALRGARVTVVHLAGHLLERQLDAHAGSRLAARLAARGIECRVSDSAQALLTGSDGRVNAVLLSGGERLPAALVVMAAGVRPRIELAMDAGLDCARGVLVDDHMRTSDERIFAIGECSEHRGRCYGLVAPTWEQAEVCARALAGEPVEYTGSSEATHLKVSGVAVYSAGRVEVQPGDEAISLEDIDDNGYRRLLVRDDRLVGAVLYGDSTDAAWYADLIARGQVLGEMRAGLVFGRGFAAPSGAVEGGAGKPPDPSAANARAEVQRDV